MKTRNVAYALTEAGKETVAKFIAECAAKRKEILDAGKDTAEDTVLPDEETILSDLNAGVGVDENGEYFNGWGVTDYYDSDTVLCLNIGKDFIEIPDNDTGKEGASV